MKYFKKKTEKTLVLKYPEIRSYVSTIPWSYKKKIVNRPVLYTIILRKTFEASFWIERVVIHRRMILLSVLVDAKMSLYTANIWSTSKRRFVKCKWFLKYKTITRTVEMSLIQLISSNFENLNKGL